MPRIDNLNASEMKRQVGRQKAIETMAPLESTAVGGGLTRFMGEESWRLEGSGTVSGVLNIIGKLKGLGELIWDSVVTFTSTFTAKGTTRLEGDTTQAGPFHIQGATDLTGNMNVKSGGKIIVEGASAATLENGELSFATGGRVTAYASGVSVVSGTSQLAVSTDGTFLFFGTANISVSSGFASISAPAVQISATNLSLSSLPAKAGAAANLHIDSAGKIWKTS